MKQFFDRIVPGSGRTGGTRSGEEILKRQVATLFGLLSNLYGPDKLVLKAAKLDAVQAMRSPNLAEQVMALQRLVHEDPTIDRPPQLGRIPEILDEIEDEISDLIARRSVEEKLDKKINERMQQRHEEYVREIKMQILKEDGGPENAQTLKRYAKLEKLETRKLAASALDVLRPKSLTEVVGQKSSIEALLTKVASPYPQHVILYGPPGVGKTTVARLVLEEAKRRPHTPFKNDAPFVEVDGTTLRWDPREVTNPLLGSVHDPIYQGARRDLAEGGVPEPKPGLVTDAHGGILFIDEIGELDPMLQNKLLKVLEDKRVSFDSAYYDPNDQNIPKYIKKLFDEGGPADFLLIGATTRDPSEINPALRSRSSEVFFEPLTPSEIAQIVGAAAGRLGAIIEPGCGSLIAEYTIEGRRAMTILADAYGVALEKSFHREASNEGSGGPGGLVITEEDVLKVIRSSRLSPHKGPQAGGEPQVGRAYGLGVQGYLGSVLEIEAVAFPAREKGKGALRFNDTAGSMFKDSVFNAASVMRRLSGRDLADYDVHCNVVGGGRIDGPSAGAAVFLAILSAITGRPVRQDTGLTGEISIRGLIKPVGGIHEKLYGARLAGVRRVLLPEDNRRDIPKETGPIEVTLVRTIDEVVDLALLPEPGRGAVPEEKVSSA